MKKILLIIALAFCIFQMVVLAGVIDIGNAAIDGDTVGLGEGYTHVDKYNSANATGTITSVELWAREALEGVKIIIFSASGNYLTARSGATIGDLASGEHSVSNGNPIEVSLAVNAGDFIGIYTTVGETDISYSSNTGLWYTSGDQSSCNNRLFTAVEPYLLRIGGIGITPSITWNGITITKWNGITITKINGK